MYQTNDNIKREMLVSAASMYYEDGLSQETIGKKLSISRSYVSKLIAEARNTGIVKISITSPHDMESTVELDIRRHFDLRRVIAVRSANHENILMRTGLAAAKYLDSIVKNQYNILVGAGTTVYNCVQRIPDRDNLEDISIVQMTGLMSGNKQNVYETEIIRILANHYRATPHIIPAPVLIWDEVLYGCMLKEPSVSETLHKARECNIALFTVGVFSTSLLLQKLRITNAKQVERMRENGAVGEISGHFIDINGKICDPDFDKHVVSLSLDDLRKIDYKICVAVGRVKVDAIYSALYGNYINVLITDEDTAIGLQEKINFLENAKR